jgi:hypothetical protein
MCAAKKNIAYIKVASRKFLTKPMMVICKALAMIKVRSSNEENRPIINTVTN